MQVSSLCNPPSPSVRYTHTVYIHCYTHTRDILHREGCRYSCVFSFPWYNPSGGTQKRWVAEDSNKKDAKAKAQELAYADR